MARRNTTEPATQAPAIPNKSRFYVSEVADMLADHVSIPRPTATTRIYRAIENGAVTAHRYLGVTMIERGEVERLLKGERV